MPAEGDAAPDFTPVRRHGQGAPPVRPARAVDRSVLLPQGRHVGLHDRGMRVPRRERGVRQSRRRGMGRERPGHGQQGHASRPSSDCPFVLLADEDHAVAEKLRDVDPEDELRQAVHGHPARHIPGRSGRPDRAALGACQARRPRSAGARGTRRRTGANGRERRHNEASPVGGDERCLEARGYTAAYTPATCSERVLCITDE